MIITSNLFTAQKNIIHGISTRFPIEEPSFNNLSKHTGDNIENVIKNRSRFFDSIGINQANLVHANQVHGVNVTLVNKPGLYPATDALITATKNLFLVISVADCMPVMLFDRQNRAIANIHSGWRGTQKNITGKTIELMREMFNTNPAELIVFMGPAISWQNFEVDKDVADLFPGKYVIPKTEAKGKYLIDTGTMVYESLLETGTKKSNIERSMLCTYDNMNLHSYRRDKDISGRMFAVIGINDK
ncbi:MAG: peptidoglycan editing factor PgeF [Ignavibacteria bacterium]|nr:peptidoglycan editing factor PgeF [Ignavibacteria bacterium]